MNRAERRRQQKLAEKTAKSTIPVQAASTSSGQQTPASQDSINLAVQHHNAGRLAEARDLYKKILQAAPDQPVALHLLGVIAHQTGNHEEAVSLIRKAIAVKPDYAEAYSNLGAPLKELGLLDEAADSYGRALAIEPNFTGAHFNIGNVFHNQGRLGEAVESYLQALTLVPDHAEAHSNLALVLNSSGRLSEAVDHYKIYLDLVWGDNRIDPQRKSFRFISKPKINHDIEQLRYLASLGPEAERFTALAEVYEAVDREIEWPNGGELIVRLSADHRRRLADTYNRPFHMVEAPAVTGSSLRSDIDVAKVTADYFSHAMGLTYVDGLLSPEALASLRAFLLGSTIWFKFSYQEGYLGATLKDGMACPLLLQIADDLRTTFPYIFKDHKLAQLWAFKYDSSLSGIQVHADFAAVNVNFWITPNEANLNPESGGLVVYNAEARMDWDFKSYNQSPKRIQQFLAECDSSETVVPYVQNRMVMFHSNLFHETDTIEFKPGYENRRINITMLFGKREG